MGGNYKLKVVATFGDGKTKRYPENEEFFKTVERATTYAKGLVAEHEATIARIIDGLSEKTLFEYPKDSKG